MTNWMEIGHHKKIELANAEWSKARRSFQEAQALEFADTLQSTAMEFVSKKYIYIKL